jgi:hypothetical protein
MRMGTLRLHEPGYEVVIGPCPGCQSWQVDYTHEVAAQFGEPSVESTQPFADVVEDILAEHLAECPHLQLLLQDL